MILTTLPSGATARISPRPVNVLSKSVRQVPIHVRLSAGCEALGSITITVDMDELSPALAQCVGKAAPEDQAALLAAIAETTFLALHGDRGAAS